MCRRGLMHSHHFKLPTNSDNGVFRAKCLHCDTWKEWPSSPAQYWGKQPIYRDLPEDRLIGGILSDVSRPKRSVGRPRKERIMDW